MAAVMVASLILGACVVFAAEAPADPWTINTEGRPVYCGNAANDYHEDNEEIYPVIQDAQGERKAWDVLLSTGDTLSYGDVGRPVVLLGDILGTGEFNISQLVALGRILTGEAPNALAQAASDVNASGATDIADLVALARWIADPKQPEHAEPYPEPEESEQILVTYFSATGSTRRVAEMLAEDMNADLFEITPETPYTQADLNYGDPDSRVCREHEDASLRDVPLVQTAPENFSEYDAVFIGYPIWWGEAAWPVNNFVADNNFSGMDVYCFCTSASSPLGQSAELLAEMTDTGDWKESVRFPSGASAQAVQDWVDSLDL